MEDQDIVVGADFQAYRAFQDIRVCRGGQEYQVGLVPKVCPVIQVLKEMQALVARADILVGQAFLAGQECLEHQGTQGLPPFAPTP
jgi:hypothetical protein